MTKAPSPIADEVADSPWPAPKIANPDIGNPTGVAYLDGLIHQVLDAQQDINLEANERMSQTLCDASALLDEVEAALRRAAALVSPPKAGAGEPVGFINAQGGFLLTDAGAEWFKSALAKAGPAPVGVTALPLYANHEARRDGLRVTDEMVEAALMGVVPGGAHVWVWLPAGTEKANRTAREIMRTALEAALAYHAPALGETQPGLGSTAETQGPLGDGRAEIVEALKAACDLAKTMEGLAACRSDDDYVWAAQAKI